MSVKMLNGQAVTDWADRIEHLAHGFGAPSCRVAVARAGRLVLTFPRRDPLAEPLPALPVPEEASVGPVEIGRCEDGTPLRLKVHGTHVLIAGATGAGKGSYLWSTIRGLLPAMRAGLVQVWALDPKRMELSFGRALFGSRYAADPKECADLLDEAVSVMQERADRFAGLQRSHTPTAADPFVLVLVDEVAFLTAYQPDKQLRQRITAALATLTTQGRAVRYGVQPKGAKPGMAPGRCKGKAHKPDHLGYSGRRVLVSRKWSNKTLTEHKQDRRTWVLEALGVEDEPVDPHRYVWRPVKPGDPELAPIGVRLLRSVHERQRWRNHMNQLQALGDGQDLSATEGRAA
ncbi:replication initiator [Microbispora hainanensis]|uniref:replication initiator n=1 Tax=Microbispora hainanensis TaxID=568844 RepID=UPI003AF3FCAD